MKTSLFSHMPDAVLEAAVQSITGKSAQDLMRDVEGLGHNCEFGQAQRKLGVDTFSLLRFGGFPVEGLKLALADEFREIERPGGVVLFAIPGIADATRYRLYIERYQIFWHAFDEPNEFVEDEKLLSDNIIRLKYLRRRFYEGLRTGRKLYVIKGQNALSLDDVLPVIDALQQYGPVTTLLVGEDPLSAYDVHYVAPGLVRGNVRYFAPPENMDLRFVNHYGWLRVCANASILKENLAKANAV